MDIHLLRQLIDPVLNQPFGERLRVGASNDELILTTPYLAHSAYGSHFTALNMSLRQKLNSKIVLNIDYQPPALSLPGQGNQKTIEGVKNILAVGSGKGGVGKSTVAALIALASQQLGTRVGMLDADIYGPNQLRLFGAPANTRLQVTEGNRFTPLFFKDIPMVSFGGISGEATPVIWRGPMISSAVQQLLMQTNWPELDLLVVDLPPGTGDIQLTLASSVQVAALVLVTTPQMLALSEADKTLAMAGKLKLPVAGYVENMGRFVCDKCHTEHHPFGKNQPQGSMSKVSQLGSLPIEPELQNATGELCFDPAALSGIEALQIAEAISLVLAILTEHGVSEVDHVAVLDDRGIDLREPHLQARQIGEDDQRSERDQDPGPGTQAVVGDEVVVGES